MTGVTRPDAWLDPLRTGNVIFDTMIVRHLCRVGAGAALEQAFRGRMFWPEAVDAELRFQSAYVPGLKAFLDLKPATVLETTSGDEDDEVEDIRVDMYTKKAARLSDTEHLGEAQCLYFAERSGLPIASNDNKAREWARNAPPRRGQPAIPVFHVMEVLLAITRSHACAPADVWTYYETACERGGLYPLAGFPIPESRDRVIADATAIHQFGP